MRDDGTTAKTVTIPRWVAALFVIGVALDILIGIALGAIALQAKHASSSAHIARVASYESCLRANEYRQADLTRWNVIIQLLRSGNDTPQLEQFIKGISKANAVADANQECGSFLP